MKKIHQAINIAFSGLCFVIISLLLIHSSPTWAQDPGVSDTIVTDSILIRNVYLVGIAGDGGSTKNWGRTQYY